jgi:hypothetical protein
MVVQFEDQNAPRYKGPLPKPRGLLPVPPEITEELARTQAAHPLKKFADSYVKMTCDDWTLRYYYEGETVASRSTPEGVEVLAVGWEEVSRFFDETPEEARRGVIIRHP